MRNTSSIRHSLVAGLVALAVLATPALLFAHARLVRAAPAANATETAAPTRLSLWFSEKPEVKLTVLALADSAGAPVPLGAIAAADSNGIVAPIVGALHAGRYTVSWRTAASDGHATSGTYQFTVAAGAAPSPAVGSAVAPAVAPTPSTQTSASDSAAAAMRADSVVTHTAVSHSLIVAQGTPTFSTAMRWTELVALLTVIGLIVFRLAVLQVAGWSRDLVADANGRAVRLGRALLVLFAITTFTRASAQASLLPSFVGSRFDALVAIVQNTRWGACWAVGVVGLVVAIIGFLLAGRLLAGWIVAAIGVVVIGVSEALTGHSGSVPNAAAAVAADVAHLLGAGGWLGGLAAVLLCGLPAVKRLDPAKASNAGSNLVRVYHGSAMECVVVVVASAIVAAWVRLPAVSALWTTPYGLALLRKIIVVLVLVAFGFYHWRRVVVPAWKPDTLARFRRTASAELLVGAVVIALTAYLLTQPLP